jgi:hypothetical protein
METKIEDLLNVKKYVDSELEIVTGDVLELSENPVNMDALLKKMKFEKTSDLINEDTKKPIVKKQKSRVNRRKSSGLIDEEYLRDLIREEVTYVFNEHIGFLMEEMSSMITKVQLNKLKESNKI